MSLGQTAEATTAHLGKQAAPRPGHLRLPQTWLFKIVASTTHTVCILETQLERSRARSVLLLEVPAVAPTKRREPLRPHGRQAGLALLGDRLWAHGRCRT